METEGSTLLAQVTGALVASAPTLEARALPTAELGVALEAAPVGRVGARTVRVVRNEGFDEETVLACFEGNGASLAEAYVGLAELAGAAHAWLIERVVLEVLAARVPGLEVVAASGKEGEDASSLVVQSWERVAHFAREHASEIGAIVEAARAHPVLGQLYAFTNLNMLCLSRCTHFPFTGDVPGIRAKYAARGEGAAEGEAATYVVFDRWNHAETEGDAARVLTYVLERLPQDCGPARSGNARDISY